MIVRKPDFKKKSTFKKKIIGGGFGRLPAQDNLAIGHGKLESDNNAYKQQNITICYRLLFI